MAVNPLQNQLKTSKLLTKNSENDLAAVWGEDFSLPVDKH